MRWSDPGVTFSHSSKPRVGISACLLGEPVRYDGGHKLNRFLRDILGRYVEWVPVCPEVECGLPVPREPMHLEGTAASPRLLTNHSWIDHTERMRLWAEKRIPELEALSLSGFVFKSRSPSSGMRNVPIYREGRLFTRGPGLFAGLWMRRFPFMPVEDEKRLEDPRVRDNFLTRLFVFSRWQALLRDCPDAEALVHFHADHKLLLMAHSPKALQTLGRIVSEVGKGPIEEALSAYVGVMMGALSKSATRSKHANVLHHVLGYFKRVLTPEEKAEMRKVIAQYHAGLVPLIVPVTLFNHFVIKYGIPHLKRQVYLHPHPVMLMLSNSD